MYYTILFVDNSSEKDGSGTKEEDKNNPYKDDSFGAKEHNAWSDWDD